MQSNIRSFFQPLARVKSETEKTEDSHLEDVLISQTKLVNGSKLGEGFTVNSASKRVPKVLKSDDEEDSVELDGKDAQADDNELSPLCVPEQKISEESISPSTSPTTSNSATSVSIPRRKTARKQLSKRKPEEDDNSYYSHENCSSKRWKEDLDGDDFKEKTNEKPLEVEEVKSENATLIEHKTDKNAKEKEIPYSTKPSSKSISNFFAPKKSSVKIEKKQAPVVSKNMPIPKCLNKVSNDESNSMADKSGSSKHTKDNVQVTSSTSTDPQNDQHGASSSSSTPRGLKSFLLKEDVTIAEILWCLHTVVTHKSVHMSEKDVELFEIMFPNNEVAKSMKLKRSKIGYSVMYGIAPYFKALLVQNISKCWYFSVGFDESLNKVSQKTQIDLNVRF